MNALLLIDGYKLDHRRQYPVKTEYVQSNYTARGSRVPGQESVGFLGLQYFLQRFLIDELHNFFSSGSDRYIIDYADRVNSYLGPNSIGTDHIKALQTKGYVPLEFRAVPEGSYVPLRVPVLTVENTHPEFGWLVNYCETLLSCTIWGPMTSMTTAGRFRSLLNKYAEETGTDPGFVDWQGHDFSFRGMFGLEAAQLSGMGHLVHFKGTDTMPAIPFIEQYYGGIPRAEIGGSVAATEHSVMCAGGAESEKDTILRLIKLYPSGIVSVVSDTWDLWKVLTETLPSADVKAAILARDGKYVTRPDSGDPTKIICGDPNSPEGSPARKGVIELLWDTFGGTKTVTGHKLLDSHVGAIYGDSINYERGDAIMRGLAEKGFASGNLVCGLGSYTYQYVTRDTYGQAMKATWCQINGVQHDLFKKPITDDGLKFSAKGRIAVLNEQGKLVLVEGATPPQEANSILQPVWRNGKFLKRWTWPEVRENAAKELQ
jgi:nicotinamide phosphoribosyltransferase